MSRKKARSSRSMGYPPVRNTSHLSTSLALALGRVMLAAALALFLGDDSRQGSVCVGLLALGVPEALEIVVLRGVLDQPFGPDIRDSADELQSGISSCVVTQDQQRGLTFPVVSTNSLYTTHSGEVSRPVDLCRRTTWQDALDLAESQSRHHAYLVVLHRRIGVLLAFLVSDLHEEATRQCLADVDPVLLVFPSRGYQREIEF